MTNSSPMVWVRIKLLVVEDLVPFRPRPRDGIGSPFEVLDLHKACSSKCLAHLDTLSFFIRFHTISMCLGISKLTALFVSLFVAFCADSGCDGSGLPGQKRDLATVSSVPRWIVDPIDHVVVTWCRPRKTDPSTPWDCHIRPGVVPGGSM